MLVPETPPARDETPKIAGGIGVSRALPDKKIA